MGREFTGWRDLVGRVQGMVVVIVSGMWEKPKALEFPTQ